MIKTITAIGLSSSGVVAAGVVGELLEDGATISKLGLVAFMGVCIIALVFAMISLCKFIVKSMLPLNNILVKLDENMADCKEVIKGFHKKE